MPKEEILDKANNLLTKLLKIRGESSRVGFYNNLKPEEFVEDARLLEEVEKDLATLEVADEKDKKAIEDKQIEINSEIEAIRESYRGRWWTFNSIAHPIKVPKILSLSTKTQADKQVAAEKKETKQKEQEKLRKEKQKDIQVQLNLIAEAHKKEADEFAYIENPKNSDEVGKNAFNAFRNALVPQLLKEEAKELRDKRDKLDDDKALKTVSGDGQVVKKAIGVAGEGVGKFLVGLDRAAQLLFGWPILAPMLAVNFSFMIAEYVIGAVSGVFAGLDKLLEGLLPSMKRDSTGDLDWSTGKNIAYNIFAATLNIIRLPSFVCHQITKMVGLGCHYVKNLFDSDRWIRKSPQISRAIIYGVGILATVGLVIASVFSLGIPLIPLVGAVIGAAIGALVKGYLSGKKKAKEEFNNKLTFADAIELAKYDYEVNNGLENKVSNKQRLVESVKKAEVEVKKDEGLKVNFEQKIQKLNEQAQSKPEKFVETKPETKPLTQPTKVINEKKEEVVVSASSSIRGK